jgi:uncharacterized repeat protein (TIGR03803 family)
LVIDASGNFYGTAGAGGANSGGTLWKQTSGGTFSVLHAFLNSTDGEDPNSLVIESSGNFFGTTGSGGANLGGTCGRKPPEALSVCYTHFPIPQTVKT